MPTLLGGSLDYTIAQTHWGSEEPGTGLGQKLTVRGHARDLCNLEQASRLSGFQFSYWKTWGPVAVLWAGIPFALTALLTLGASAALS